MRRRELFIALAGVLIARSPGTRAQQVAVPVIGLIGPLVPGAAAEPYLRSLREGLGEVGYIEGKNVAIEYRWAENADRLPALLTGLVQSKVNVIAAIGGTAVALAAKAATSTIPIVFDAAIDPVAVGLVKSFAHPGGNVTGISFLNTELMPKRFQLLSELVPEARAMALLVQPTNPGASLAVQEVQKAARARGVQLHVLKASTAADIDTAFDSCAQLRVAGLVVLNDPLFGAGHWAHIAALSLRHGIPAILAWREFVEVGGLISYGPSLRDVSRQQGIYLGRILNGEKPADLPVQQPTKFELVINMKTAKALGLTVPPLLLAQADEVIE